MQSDTWGPRRLPSDVLYETREPQDLLRGRKQSEVSAEPKADFRGKKVRRLNGWRQLTWSPCANVASRRRASEPSPTGSWKPEPSFHFSFYLWLAVKTYRFLLIPQGFCRFCRPGRLFKPSGFPAGRLFRSACTGAVTATSHSEFHHQRPHTQPQVTHTHTSCGLTHHSHDLF